MKNPIVSIVIATYSGSANVLDTALKGISAQKCPKNLFEVVIADNHGGTPVKELAKKVNAKVIEVKGEPPQVCLQRNVGAKVAKGDYILILDHDVELSPNLIGNFVKLIKKRKDIDAWYLPYKIIAKGRLLTKIRNFEEEFYKNSVIAAARIFKKEIYWKTESQYDLKLNSGPADWDFDIQLMQIGAKFAYVGDYVYHHEEQLGFWKFTSKKTIYIEGGEIYKKKWQKNSKIYQEIVKKQYDPIYRLFGIFIEKGKWKKLLSKLPLYLLFLFIKISMAMVYQYNLKKY